MPSQATLAPYAIVPHAAVRDLPAQALRLASAAFAGYDGVTLPTPGKVNWYLARPRMRRDLSMGAVTASGELASSELVSSVYITLEQVRLAGELAPVALVDTVMTAPAHRRHGLARRTLLAALEAASAAGAVAALLFTVPDSMPYHLYRSLGFDDAGHIRVMARHGQGVVPCGVARPATRDDAATLRAFWNHVYGAHDGYAPLDEALWRWRREERPAVLPATTWLAPASGPIAAAVNLCQATVIGAAASAIVLTDLAWTAGADGLAGARALLARLPASAEARALAPENDLALAALLDAAGFVEVGREAALLKPLAVAGEGLLSGLRAPWYALPESVIGV